MRGDGFTVITVAFDRCAEDARPFIERAAPTHPSLIDSEHIVADLYGMVNVPTVVWIDETGRIVRPKTSEFGTDTFSGLTGIEPGPHLAAVRAWVKAGTLELDETAVREQDRVPTADDQLAKTEYALAWHLHQSGRNEAAERHFLRAGELAPLDWTVRRAALPIRGLDPMGEPFLALWEEKQASGQADYPRVTE